MPRTPRASAADDGNHRQHGSSGHVWQGRFKAFPCQDDDHLLTVLRSIGRNALRAGLVERAEAWPLGSLTVASGRSTPVPLELGSNPSRRGLGGSGQPADE